MIDKDGAYLHTRYSENGLNWRLVETESIPHSVRLFTLNREQLRCHILATTKDTFKSDKGDLVTHMRNTIEFKFTEGKITPLV